MDTVMNYNSTPNTQVLPFSIDKVFPEIYHQIKEDKFRGNFLSVAGRLVDDAALMDSFWYHYNQVKSGKNLDLEAKVLSVRTSSGSMVLSCTG